MLQTSTEEENKTKDSLLSMGERIQQNANTECHDGMHMKNEIK